MVPTDFHSMDNKYYAYQQLLGYQLSLKYLLLCSTEERNSGLEQVKGE